MGKNAKMQKRKIFGNKSVPKKGSDLRLKHEKLISDWILNFLGVKNGKTPGKINSNGKLIDKPNWDHGALTYEDNPDAMVHEVAHLLLMPEGVSLAEYDQEMREQFGFLISEYGFMQQKKSVFEILPMGVEQKIRRVLGLPACTNAINVEANSPVRRELETGRPCAIRIKTKTGKFKDLIRLSKNVDAAAQKRLDMIFSGVLQFDVNKGWSKKQNIDAKINARALKAA